MSDNEKRARTLAVTAEERLSAGERLAYGCGDTACNIVFGMISTLLTLFYTDYAGIPVATGPGDADFPHF